MFFLTYACPRVVSCLLFFLLGYLAPNHFWHLIKIKQPADFCKLFAGQKTGVGAEGGVGGGGKWTCHLVQCCLGKTAGTTESWLARPPPPPHPTPNMPQSFNIQRSPPPPPSPPILSAARIDSLLLVVGSTNEIPALLTRRGVGGARQAATGIGVCRLKNCG